MKHRGELKKMHAALMRAGKKFDKKRRDPKGKPYLPEDSGYATKAVKGGALSRASGKKGGRYPSPNPTKPSGKRNSATGHMADGKAYSNRKRTRRSK